MCSTGRGSSSPPTGSSRSTLARRTCAGRRTAARKARRRTGSGPAGASRPAHPEVGSAAGRSCRGAPSSALSPSSSSTQRYLPRRPTAVNVRPSSRATRSSGPAEVPADRPRVAHLDLGHPFGQGRVRPAHGGPPRPREFGHRAASSALSVRERVGVRRRPLGVSPVTRAGPRDRARATAMPRRAALLGLLLGAARPRCRAPARRPRTVALNTLRWSGPSSVIRYSGGPSSEAAVSSCRLVFQSSPAPSSGAARSSSANSRTTTSRAVSSPCCRYTAPINASVASARMLALA